MECCRERKEHPLFVGDGLRFFDNVLQDVIDKAPGRMSKARYAAERERSVGLGVMGFHSFLQANGVPWESVMAKVWNRTIFKHIKDAADTASRKLAEERGPCPDRSEEHTSELQSLMRISYAVFCLKKKKKTINILTSILPIYQCE